MGARKIKTGDVLIWVRLCELGSSHGITTWHYSWGRREEIVSPSSLVVRITAWYDWLLVVLVLMFGAYTCKCLDYCLSLGVKNALSMRAKELGTAFAATGQIPPNQGSPRPGLTDTFVSVSRSGGLAPGPTGQRESQPFAPGSLRKEPNSPAASASLVRQTGSNSRFVIASANSTFSNEKYVVEVGAPNKPIKAVFRQAAFALVIGLVVALALVTWGSVFLVKRALAPVQKIAQSVQALPLAHPDQRIRAVVVREQIENLFDTVNEMVSQLEVSFQIGTGLPAEAFHALSTRLRRVSEDLADSFESEGLSIGVAATLLCLLKETERLSDLARNLAMLSDEDPGQRRTERLRFYLGGFAVAGAEHVCLLIEKLGADLASEARDPSGGKFPVRW